MEALDVPAWKAKLVARRTHARSVVAAAYVDAELAPVLATRGAPTIERVVAEAIARFGPAELAQAERVGREAWQVEVHHPGPGDWAGTSWLEARADTLDLARFADVVADIAEVHAGANLDHLIAALTTRDAEAVRRPPGRGRDLQVYVHLDAPDLPADSPAGPGTALVESLGPATLERVEAWLARHTATGGRVRVTPVVDPTRADAVDRHDPPPWMAEQVRLRDPRCVFPGCPTHTSAKTHDRWRYRRLPDGSYAWTSAHGDHYLVREGGTLALADH